MKINKDQITAQFAGIVKFDEPLSRHTTFKLGGAATVFLEPQTKTQIVEALTYVQQNKLPYFILGGGSNVLISDKGFNGVVIKPRNSVLKIDGNKVMADAGVVLGKVASDSAKAGLTGLEWGIAVPGTVGGAVRGNAGAFGGEIKDTLISAEVFDGKDIRTLTNKELDFSYRTSRIKKMGGKEIVLSATFELKPGDPKPATAKVKELLAKKFTAQPMGERCAGCLFKNIEVNSESHQLRAPSTGNPTEIFLTTVPAEFWQKGTVPAGWLIEQAGLKGYTKNGAKVSEKHANFIVNDGLGNADAVLDLAAYVKAQVFAKFGVHLQEEVEILTD